MAAGQVDAVEGDGVRISDRRPCPQKEHRVMERERYEVPAIVSLGSVTGLTLGSGGSCCDGANGRNKALTGTGLCERQGEGGADDCFRQE